MQSHSIGGEYHTGAKLGILIASTLSALAALLVLHKALLYRLLRMYKLMKPVVQNK